MDQIDAPVGSVGSVGSVGTVASGSRLVGHRIVVALAITQTVGYGALYYCFAVLLSRWRGISACHDHRHRRGWTGAAAAA